MANADLGQIAIKIYGLLKNLEEEERIRVTNSVQALFGDAAFHGPDRAGEPSGAEFNSGSKNADGAQGAPTLISYLKEKELKTKGEVFAAIARYRELFESKAHTTKEDFIACFGKARRTFDNKNFARDIDNAKRQARFFIAGSSGDGHQLSHYGQEYIDALPDRNAVSELTRPKKAGGRGKKKAKRSTVRKVKK